MMFAIFISVFLQFNFLAFADQSCNTDLQNLRSAAFQMKQKALFAKTKCTHLKDGESKNVDMKSEDSPSGVTHGYKLSRVGEQKYLSEVYLEFTGRDGIGRDEVDAFKNKVQTCLKETDGLLKGPNGESLKIRIGSYTAPLMYVDLYRDVARADSKTYSLKMDCYTIVHEILHLHGLVDVYHEYQVIEYSSDTGRPTFRYPSENERSDFNCRHQGPSENISVMDNQKTAFELTKMGKVNFYRGVWCTGKNFAYSGELFCRPDEKTEEQDLGFNQIPVGSEEDKRLINAGRTQFKSINRSSLLLPAEFNVITQPGCADVNELYYDCAANAYVTEIKSKDSSIGFTESSSCQPTPKACQDPSIWLENKKPDSK